MTDVHELRVHGVHNTKPANMLGIRPHDCPPDQPDEQVRRVAGDDLTSFWQECSPKGLGRLRSREAYSWGNINASPKARVVPSLARAAWLLLLPYAFVNVGYWSRTNLGRADGGTKAGMPGAATFRLAGVLLTAMFVTTATQIGADLVAWQCYVGKESNCSWLPPWLSFMEDLQPVQRIAVGCALPILMLLVLWLLSRQSLHRYEEVPPPPSQNGAGKSHVLEAPGLWSGRRRVLRLQRLHLAAGLACVVIVTGWPVVVLAGDGPRSWLVYNLYAAVLVLAACVALTVFQATDGPDYPDESPPAAKLPGVALGAAGGVMLSHLLALGFGGFDVAQAGALPGSGVIPLVLPILLVLLVLAVFLRTHVPLVALALVVPGAIAGYVHMNGNEAHGVIRFASAAAAVFVACAVLQRARRGRGENTFRGWGGSAPAVLLGAAVFFTLLYSTAATLFVADRLNGGPSVTRLEKSPFAEMPLPGPTPRAEACMVAEHTAERFDVACTKEKPSRNLAVPVVHFWLAAGLFLSLVSWLVVMVAAYLLFTWSKLARETIRAQAEASYPPISSEREFPEPRRRFQLGRVVATRRRAAFAHRAERLVGLLCPLTALSILLALAGALTRQRPWELPDKSATALAEGIGHASLFVIATVALGIVTLGAAAYRTAPLRGTLGIIWDLASFWPRAAHPFSPPCYAERAVPEICTRIRYRLQDDGRVVLSAHSLGSTLAVAAIFRFPTAERQRIALLCYGSQLRSYFGRLFPAVFGAPTLGNAPARQAPLRDEAPYGGLLHKRKGTLAADLDAGSNGRWLNLYRPTDYLGFRVYGDARRNGVDRPIPETRIPWSAGDPAPHPVETHGDYPMADEYDSALQQVITVLEAPRGP